jgi:hypothetical protein
VCSVDSFYHVTVLVIASMQYPAPTAELIVPRQPRPSNASIVAAPEFVADYTTLFKKKWLNTEVRFTVCEQPSCESK